MKFRGEAPWGGRHHARRGSRWRAAGSSFALVWEFSLLFAPGASVRSDAQLVVVHHRTVLAHGLDEGELLDQAVSDEHPRDELVVVEILASEFEVPVALP